MLWLSDSVEVFMCSLMLFYFVLTSFFFYRGSFRWTAEKETFLLREIRDVEPYKFKRGTNETGQAWSEVADDVNQHEGFKVMPIYQRSVRDRFNKLLSDAERGGEGQEQILSLCLKQKLC